MKLFNKGDKSKSRDFRSSQGSRPGMHRVICSECGKECEVPFRPSGERPVFCAVCFEKHGKANSTGSGGKFHQRPGFDKKRMFEAICSNGGIKCEVLFRPAGDKPVYCSDCFRKKGKASAAGQAPDQIRQQLEVLNSKLDKILQALTPAVSLKAPEEKKTAKAKKEVKKTKAGLKKAKAKKK